MQDQSVEMRVVLKSHKRVVPRTVDVLRSFRRAGVLRSSRTRGPTGVLGASRKWAEIK